MTDRLRNTWGLAVACAAATMWAINLTVIQRLTEPTKPWHDKVGENNTYWARDLRFMTLVAALGAVLLVRRGNRPWYILALGPLVWLAIDVWLDRIDVAGTGMTVVLAGVACLVLLASALLGRAAADEARPVPLLFVACVGAAMAPLAAAIESPSDSEAALNPSAAATAALLILMALGCAAQAGPDMSRQRALATGAVAAIAGAVVAATRLTPPGSIARLAVALALGALLITAVAALSRPWPDRAGVRRYAGVAVLALIGYEVLLFGMVLVTIFFPIAPAFTAWAGNPPVNSADMDTIYASGGLLAGIAVAAALRAGNPLRAIPNGGSPGAARSDPWSDPSPGDWG